jgi:hypothetical protein
MSTAQTELPLAVAVYDASGAEVLRHSMGNLRRSDSVWVELDALLDGPVALPSGYGHLCLLYDFSAGSIADGWLHAIFRYEHRRSGHAAETSFGSHLFNTVLTLGKEPQSYAGDPPGLSTRLFLRLGDDGHETLCHLIYPASTPWHPRSETDLVLYDRNGQEVLRRRVAIPCNASYLWRASEMFPAQSLARAQDGGYIIVRDLTCRLFGYHGLIRGDAFSLDHMFGF